MLDIHWNYTQIINIIAKISMDSFSTEMIVYKYTV